MNIPPYVCHALVPSLRHKNEVIRNTNNSIHDLLNHSIHQLLNLVTSNTPLTTLLIDKIGFIRQLNAKILTCDKKFNKITQNRYEKALNLRLKILLDLLDLDQSSKLSLKIYQDEKLLISITNKILNNNYSTLIHYISILTSIALNKSITDANSPVNYKTNLLNLKDNLIFKINQIVHSTVKLDIYNLACCLSLFSVLYNDFKTLQSKKTNNIPLFSPNWILANQNKSLDLITPESPKGINNDAISNDKLFNLNIITSILNKICENLLEYDDFNTNIKSLLLESIADIIPSNDDCTDLYNVDKLFKKLLYPKSDNIILPPMHVIDKYTTNQLHNSTSLSKALYGIYKSGSLNTPLFNQILASLTENNVQQIIFKNTIELFRTSFALIISNQITINYISKWLLKETVRLSSEAIKYPSQFLFLLTGLSLSPNLSFVDSEKTIGSSISFDKLIYEKAEAELKRLETGHLSFNSDILSMKHLFGLAESLLPTISDNEFVHLLHAFCSTKLHHPRLVKMKLYSESLKRLPRLPIETIPQLLRSCLWLLTVKSDDTRRLAFAITDRLLGELAKNSLDSFIITESLMLLDRCNVYSNELANISSIVFNKHNYQELNELNFGTSSHVLHYLSSSSITLNIKTSSELKESFLEIARDVLFNKSIYTIKHYLKENDNKSIISTNKDVNDLNTFTDITVDNLTNILHSAHIKGEVTRYNLLVELLIDLVNKNLVSMATGDSLNRCTKMLSVITGKEYKFKIIDGIYQIFKNEI